MLVLSRKVGQGIVIGDGIRVIVNRIDGNRVSLAMDAPLHVKIVRDELEPLGCPVPSVQPPAPLPLAAAQEVPCPTQM